jgi:hypothetical protein
MEWKTGLKTFRESLLPARAVYAFQSANSTCESVHWEILSVRDLLGAPTMRAILRVVCVTTSGCRYSSWSSVPSVGQSKRTNTDGTERHIQTRCAPTSNDLADRPGYCVAVAVACVQKPGLRCVSPGMYVRCGGCSCSCSCCCLRCG